MTDPRAEAERKYQELAEHAIRHHCNIDDEIGTGLMLIDVRKAIEQAVADALQSASETTELAKVTNQRNDFRRQLTAEREGRMEAERLVDEVRARNRELEGTPITDNDRRWRFLEHGCQWVAWVPINGQQVSFDPRNVTGFAGDLLDMRGQADIEIRNHLNILREGAAALERKLKDG